MVKYKEAFSKPLSDTTGLIIGILLSLIPIVNVTVVTGFAIESSGLGKTKSSKKMPEWKNWGHLFTKGLAAIAINTIYLIPAIVVITIGLGLAIGDITSIMLSTAVTPEIMDQIATGEIASQEVEQMFSQNWYLMLPTIIKVAPIVLVGFLLALIAGLLTPMAVLNYVKKRRFGAAFELGTILNKILTGKYLATWLVVIFLGMILGSILSFIPLLGPAITLFVVGVIQYSLYGQVYKEV